MVLAKRRAGLSASSVRTIYTMLRAALDVAVRDGLIQRNPAALVKRPAVERKDAGYLSAQQAEALLEAIRGDRLGAPRAQLLRHHGRHLQPRCPGAAARGGRQARAGDPLVTLRSQPRCGSGCGAVAVLTPEAGRPGRPTGL